jgi:hypothetical protein
MRLQIFDRPKRKRKPPRVMAKRVDGTADLHRFRCRICRWESVFLRVSKTTARRGIPCPRCNSMEVTT